MAMSGDQIYRNFKDSAGNESMSAAWGISWNAHDTLPERAVQINRLASKIESHWKGSASGGAQRGLGPIEVDLMAAGQDHDATQDAVYTQSHAYTRARDTVVEVPPQPNMQDIAKQFSGGSLQDIVAAQQTMEQQTIANQAANRHNVATFETYHGSATDNSSRMPMSINKLEPGGNNVSVVPHRSPEPRKAGGPSGPMGPVGPGPDSGGDGGYTGSGYHGGDSGGSGGSGGSSAHAPHIPAPGGHRPSVPEPTGSTGTAGADWPGANPGVNPNAGADTYRPPAANLPNSPGTTGFGAPGGNVAGGLGAFNGGFGSAGSGRIGSVLGGGGSAGGAAEPGAPRGGATGPTPGARTGAGSLPNETTAAGRAGAGATAGRGGAGATGMGPAGAGGKKDEDKQHKSASYLRESDPNSLYGVTERTPPPVIGDKKK